MPSPRSSRPSPRPSSPRPSHSRSSSARPSGAALDPYGIYGARTATRLRDSQRRRRSQNLLAFFIFLVIGAAIIVAWKTRRVNTSWPQSRVALGFAVASAPTWIQPAPGTPGVLLIAGEDGRLVKTSAFTQTNAESNPESNTAQAVAKTILLETDFPLRAPLIFQDTAFVPCEDGVLYAVSWRERKLIWRQRFDAALSSQPALITVNQKPVIVAGSDAGLMLGLDAATGRVLWRARLPAPIGNGLTAVQSTPQVSGQNASDRVLVPLLGGAAMRGGLWCLDGASGKVLWRFPRDVRVEATQLSSVVAGSGQIFGANDAGAVYCLDLQSGNYNPKVSGAPQTPIQNQIQTQAGWKTFIRPLKDGDQEQVTLLRAAPVLVISGNGNANLVLGGNDGGVRGLNARDGKLLWQTDIGAPISSLLPLQKADGSAAVLACNRSGELTLLDAQNGAVLRKFASDGERFVGATISPQGIYGLTSNGTLLRFELS